MDAWSLTYSADIGSYGWSAQLSYVPGFRPEEFSNSGNLKLIGTTKSSIGQMAQEVEVYSEAKAILEGGELKTSFRNADPHIFISIPPRRQQTWDYLSGGGDGFKNISSKQAEDDWGMGGWTVLAILKELVDKFSVSFEIPSSFDRFDYHVAYWRIEPYSDILGEFKKMFPGVPAVFHFDASADKVTVKLAPFSTVTPNFSPRKSITIRYFPQKKVTIMVHGGMGKPRIYGDTEVTLQNTATLINEIEETCYWGDDVTPLEITKGQTFNPTSLLKGTLYSKYSLGAYRQVTTPFAIKTPNLNGAETGTDEEGTPLYSVEGEKVEILNSLGLPIATLTSKASHSSYRSVHTTEDEIRHVYTSHEGFVCSHGESVKDLQYIDRRTRTLTVLRCKIKDQYKWLPSSVSFSYINYEDMLSDARDEISSTSPTAVGRKTVDVTHIFELYQVSIESFNSTGGSYSGARKVTSNSLSEYDSTKHVLALFLVKTTTRHYEPLGASGYKTTNINHERIVSTNEAVITTSPGSGDSSNYLSQVVMGPGWEKVRASEGDGEPEMISIPVCDWTEAQDYASNVYEYYKGYFQVTEVEEQPHCYGNVGTPGAGGPNFSLPSDKVGTYSSSGLLTSINVSITPSKTITTKTFKYYDDSEL